MKTDPYGHLLWCIGSADDFWCFDYHEHDDGTVTIHAVINSETGHFIQDAEEPVRILKSDAVDIAKGFVDQALEWCVDNDIEHDTDGWNQSPCWFWRSMQSDFNGTGSAPRKLKEVS
jgi:hypothetical protein